MVVCTEVVEVVGEIAVEVGVGVAVVVVVRVPTQRGQQNTVVSLQVPLNTVSPVYRAFHTNWKLVIAHLFHDLYFSFTLLFSVPSPQLPHLLSYFTRSRPTTRQLNTIILVQCGLAIRGGLRNYSTGCYLVPRTFEDRSPIILFLEEIPHRIKQVTLRRSLPGSQCLLFLLELEVHPSQPPRTQRAWLKDDDNAVTTDRDDTTI